MVSIKFWQKKETPCECSSPHTISVKNNTEKTDPPQKTTASSTVIKVLGSGCAKCYALEASTAEALKELGMDTPIEHITDFALIAAYGVMSTPALVVNGKVVSFGKALKKDDVIKILQKTDEVESL